MFPLHLGSQLNKKKDERQKDRIPEQQKSKSTSTNWFHCYQVPEEEPKRTTKPMTKPRSRSLDSMPIYPPMDPSKKIEWNKVIPHPHINTDKEIPMYPPMDPHKKMDWDKIIHPHIPHPHLTKPADTKDWFHCYQVPDEKPKSDNTGC
eukprot:75930_1